MPHSSGGGSHSSGGHSGSGGSSHSSGGGSHSSGRSMSRPAVTIRTKPFNGSSKYIHYHNGTSSIVYANEKEMKRHDSPRWVFSIFYIPFIIAIITMIASSFSVIKKLDTYRLASQIEDNISVLGNKEVVSELKDAIKIFYEKTGISISVVTISNDDWRRNYNSLENWVYDYYIRNYSDEDHWIIVYSQDEDEIKQIRYVDWYWEGMQGDNTDGILTGKYLDQFNSDMQKNLTKVDGKNVGIAINSALRNNMEFLNVGKITIEWTNIGVAIFMLAFISFHSYFMIFAGAGQYKKDYKKCPDDEEIEILARNCEYCGGLYYLGTVTKCPHCNAPIQKK